METYYAVQSRNKKKEKDTKEQTKKGKTKKAKSQNECLADYYVYTQLEHQAKVKKVIGSMSLNRSSTSIEYLKLLIQGNGNLNGKNHVFYGMKQKSRGQKVNWILFPSKADQSGERKAIGRAVLFNKTNGHGDCEINIFDKMIHQLSSKNLRQRS
jgi:hypothetical protein